MEISAHLSISDSGAEDGLAEAPLPYDLVHAIPFHSALNSTREALASA